MSLFLQVFCMVSCLLLSPLLVEGISARKNRQISKRAFDPCNEIVWASYSFRSRGSLRVIFMLILGKRGKRLMLRDPLWQRGPLSGRHASVIQGWKYNPYGLPTSYFLTLTDVALVQARIEFRMVWCGCHAKAYFLKVRSGAKPLSPDPALSFSLFLRPLRQRQGEKYMPGNQYDRKVCSQLS